ncbi:MAG: OpgC domain-containing protein [Pseudomonadota bacterium]
MNPTPVPAAQPKPAKKPRDLRLDFFRGLGMFIIFIAHVPMNDWKLWIPARFGFSDATEQFVFCSGMASAIAFGAVYRYRSFWLGTARVAYRCWQVYWAHIAMFMVIVAMLAAFDTIPLGTGINYTERLYVIPFLDDTLNHIVALMTLSYVPNYFDILPMYLVLLALMPIVVPIGMIDRRAAIAFVVGVWFLAQENLWLTLFGFSPGLEFSAEVRTGVEREWFFNPFGWIIVFYFGFFWMIGWLPRPPVNAWLIALAVGVLLFNLLIGSRFGLIWGDAAMAAGWTNVNTASVVFQWLVDVGLIGKTDQGILRFTHFLALAYLCWIAAGENGRYLQGGGLWGLFVAVVRKVGQQSLAIFLTGMVLSQFVGAMLDFTDRTTLDKAVANLGGFLFLIATAYAVAWFKSEPWRKPPAAPAGATREASGAGAAVGARS